MTQPLDMKFTYCNYVISIEQFKSLTALIDINSKW
jgi:hypothetical protein